MIYFTVLDLIFRPVCWDELIVFMIKFCLYFEQESASDCIIVDNDKWIDDTVIMYGKDKS